MMSTRRDGGPREAGFRALAELGGDADPVVWLRGDLDMATTQQAWSVIAPAAAGAAQVVLDLREVTFIDSAGLGLLLRVRRLVGDAGATLVLRAPTPATCRVLEFAGLVDHFDVR
jgi:anti-sigma B factor antagonist